MKRANCNENQRAKEKVDFNNCYRSFFKSRDTYNENYNIPKANVARSRWYIDASIESTNRSKFRVKLFVIVLFDLSTLITLLDCIRPSSSFRYGMSNPFFLYPSRIVCPYKVSLFAVLINSLRQLLRRIYYERRTNFAASISDFLWYGKKMFNTAVNTRRWTFVAGKCTLRGKSKR